MATFLHGTSLLEKVKELIGNDAVDVAVAYWGSGAFDMLGITGAKPVRILCDLMSVGCNPYEIERALGAPYAPAVEVRHLPRLHAKVYLSDRAAIVGSANASTNGLGNQDRANIEAAIYDNDASSLSDIRYWFDQAWKRSTKITPNLIKEAKELIRPPSPDSTFLRELIQNPAWFGRKVTLVYIDDFASPAAKKAFSKIAANHYSQKLRESWGPNEEPFYQAEESKAEIERTIQPGDYLINCCFENTPVSSVKEPGCIEIADDDFIVLLNDGLKRVRGLPFSQKERKALFRAVERYLDLSKYSPDQQLHIKKQFASSVNLMDTRLRSLIAEELITI